MVDVVEEYVGDEKHRADLLHQLINPHAPADFIGSGNQDDDYVDISRLGVNEFEQVRRSQLPKEIKEQLDRKLFLGYSYITIH